MVMLAVLQVCGRYKQEPYSVELWRVVPILDRWLLGK